MEICGFTGHLIYVTLFLITCYPTLNIPLSCLCCSIHSYIAQTRRNKQWVKLVKKSCSHHSCGWRPWPAGCCHGEAGSGRPPVPPSSPISPWPAPVRTPSSRPAAASCTYWCAARASASRTTSPFYPPAAAACAGTTAEKNGELMLGGWRDLVLEWHEQKNWL